MKDVGRRLKEEREKKGIALSEVALYTKIGLRFLQALEAGDTNALPPKTFVRGFVQSYAKFLGLNVDEIMTQFRGELGSTNIRSESLKDDRAPSQIGETTADSKFEVRSESSRPGKPESPAPTTPRATEAGGLLSGKADAAINQRTSLGSKAVIVSVIGVLLLIIIWLGQKMESYQEEAHAPPPTELQGLNSAGTLPPATPEPSPTLVPLSGADTIVAPVQEPTPLAASTATPSPSPTASPSPSPTPAPTATPTPAPSPTPAPTPTPQPSPSPSPTPASRNLDVMIEALDVVDVRVTADSDAPRQLRLSGDSVQRIQARRRVVLEFSDGGAINLIVNGVDRGVPGDLGRPLRLEIP